LTIPFFFFFLFFVFSKFFFPSAIEIYIIKCYLFKGVIFLFFTLKLMLLFIIMNMSNSKVYFMRQNASVPGGKVSALVEYAIMQGRSSVPRSVARAHFNPSAPIIGHPRHVVCSPRPLPPVCPHWCSVRAQSRSVRTQSRSVLAQSSSVRAYRKKSAPAGCSRRMPGYSIKGGVPQQERQPFPSTS
jgi:hypothetical protein